MADNEPQPVISLRDVVGFVGILTMLTGAVGLVIGCNRFLFNLCTSSLLTRSTVAMAVGSLILLARWVIWGDKPAGQELRTVRSRLKRVVATALAYLLLAFVIAIAFMIGPVA